LELQYENYFCLMFTSIPYFRLERYSEDKGQSCHRYKTLDDWINGFLLNTLKKSWKMLRVGGHMAINASNVYMNHTINDFCNPMNEYIKNILGGRFVETIGYQLSKRPQSKSSKSGIFSEPIFIWQKVK